jgi:predicted DNA-binding transcriptional regulator AlpA
MVHLQALPIHRETVDADAAPEAAAATRTMYTMRALEQRLNCHRSTIMALVERGALPRPFKLSPNRSGQLRFDSVETEAAIARLRI